MHQPIVVARFGAPHGVKGDLKLHSFTEDPQSILKLKPLLIQVKNNWQPIASGFSVRPHGQTFLAHIPGIDSPEAARAYVNCDVAVDREQLSNTTTDEYYHCDLEGLAVQNLNGELLGHVDHILSTGANDVLVIQKPRSILIPFVKAYVQSIDLNAQKITVDWDLEWSQ